MGPERRTTAKRRFLSQVSALQMASPVREYVAAEHGLPAGKQSFHPLTCSLPHRSHKAIEASQELVSLSCPKSGHNSCHPWIRRRFDERRFRTREEYEQWKVQRDRDPEAAPAPNAPPAAVKPGLWKGAPRWAKIVVICVRGHRRRRRSFQHTLLGGEGEGEAVDRRVLRMPQRNTDPATGPVIGQVPKSLRDV